MNRSESIAIALAEVRNRVATAGRAAGRREGCVRLLAVSKGMPAEDIRAALAAGQLDFGENYAQELRDKRHAFAATATATTGSGLAHPRWHFIGPLQSNKVKYVAGQVDLVHTVADGAILAEIDRRVAGLGAPVQECLIQVNVAGEARKSGVAPDELPSLLDRFTTLAHVRCVGLMVIPPADENPEAARPHFVELRRLLEREAARTRVGVALRELSMGMSHDLEVAIAEGATVVRVGTAIFGARAR
jgi:hypothetical protein